MKKIYTLALAAALCMSANAAQRQQMTSSQIQVNKTLGYVESQTVEMPSFATMKKAPATVDDVAGIYTWTANSLLQSSVINHDIIIEVDDAAKGTVKVTLMSIGDQQSSLPITVAGVVDLAAGTLSIANNQKVGQDADGDIIFYLKEANQEGEVLDGKSDAAATVGTIATGAITFPATDIWALGDYNAENLGWYFLCYNNAFGQEIEENPDDWTDFGTATFIDGWGISGAGKNPADYPWVVEIQQNVETSSIYRIHNPYKAEGCPLSSVGKLGNIVFSIDNPACVLVYPSYFSGLMNGSEKLYFFNLEGNFFMAGATFEEIAEAFAEQDMPMSTYSNGVVDIPNCRFDIEQSCTKNYVWQTEQGASLVNMMKSKITFDRMPSGIDEVAVSENNAPVEYFNLQGMRVVNPENGLYIRRQGNKVEKVFVK